MSTKAICRTQIEGDSLQDYIDNLYKCYTVIQLSHATYVIDIRVFHSVIAIVAI
jgi:hypothetical protein